MKGSIRPSQVLDLYRNLLRYGQQLKLTDQKYYSKRIREEFEANKDEQSPEKIEFLFKKGQSLLQKRRLI